MASEPSSATAAGPLLRAGQVYTMALLCLVAGLAAGYVMRASQAPVTSSGPASIGPMPLPPLNPPAAANPPSLDEMRQMAEIQAAPLQARLQTDPNNTALLAQLGAIYHSAHEFGQAAAYFGKAVQADPKDVALRIKLAISLYRAGSLDEAIAQLNHALRDDPNDSDALFNLGVIRLEGKHDGAGAVTAWRQLLKTNPQLSPDRKAEVQKLIADVLPSLGDQDRNSGARNDDRP